jgi:hypothetical protein
MSATSYGIKRRDNHTSPFVLVWYNAFSMTNIENGVRPTPVPEIRQRLGLGFEQSLRNAVTPERARLIGFASTKRAESII